MAVLNPLSISVKITGRVFPVLLLCATALAVQPATPPVIPENVKANLRSRVEFGHITGVAVGMINRDGRAFFNAGTMRAGSGLAITSETIFEIGSITKAFTGTLLADMLVRGEVALTNTVQSYLPAEATVPRGAREITLLHLATHRSGLPDNPDNLCGQGLQGLFDCYTVERLYEFLNGHTLASEPNTAWVYSNTGFGLLGHALSLKASLGYEVLLRERLLDPLGLNDTRITLSAEQRSRRATAHWGVVPWGEFSMPALDAAGALHSTTADLLTFIEYLSGIKTNLATVATEALRRRAETGAPTLGMALGWLLVRLPNGEVVHHDGSTYGQNAFIGFNRSTRQGVVVLCNNRASAQGSIQDAGFHLLDSNMPLTSPRKPATVPLETLASYEGRYQSAEGFTFDAQVRFGQLTLNFVPDGSPGFSVHAESADRFTADEVAVNGAAEFKLQGGAATLTWSQNGASIPFNRVALLPRLSIKPGGALQLIGTPGFSYDLHGSSNLAVWTRQGSRRVDDGEFGPPAPSSEKGFFRATLPALESLE